MAEDNKPENANGADEVIDVGLQSPTPQVGPAIRVVTQFVRDLSFENPRAPESLQSTEAPKMEVDAQTYAVRADGQLLSCEPAQLLPMAQRYFLF